MVTDEIIQEWKDKMDEHERNQVSVLDAYFTNRRNLPGKNILDDDLIEDPKSTEEIIDELSEMMPLSIRLVADYMMKHEYGFTTSADGIIKWAIWRDMSGLM